MTAFAISKVGCTVQYFFASPQKCLLYIFKPLSDTLQEGKITVVVVRRQDVTPQHMTDTLTDFFFSLSLLENDATVIPFQRLQEQEEMSATSVRQSKNKEVAATATAAAGDKKFYGTAKTSAEEEIAQINRELNIQDAQGKQGES